jgi:NADP-dependent 3-hydroxy acid dehydrogenase YdfG
VYFPRNGHKKARLGKTGERRVRIIAFAKLLQQWLEVHPLRNQSTIIKDATAAFSHEGMHAVYEVNGLASKEKIPLNVAQLDVNDNSSVDNAIGNIVRENGRIDILVNNAGYDLFGSLEESSLEEIKQHLRQMFSV